MSWFKDLFRTGRRGLLPVEATGGGLLNKGVHYNGMIELEELEQAGNLSRIRIIKVTGLPSTIKDRLPEWIETKEIQWLEGSDGK